MNILSLFPTGKTITSEIIEETEIFINNLNCRNKEKIIDKIYDYEDSHPLNNIFKKYQYDYEKLQAALLEYKKQKLIFLNSINSKK